jgi:hypothetical protein
MFLVPHSLRLLQIWVFAEVARPRGVSRNHKSLCIHTARLSGLVLFMPLPMPLSGPDEFISGARFFTLLRPEASPQSHLQFTLYVSGE